MPDPKWKSAWPRRLRPRTITGWGSFISGWGFPRWPKNKWSSAASRSVTITPIPDSLPKGTETVTLSLAPAAEYLIGPDATISIADLPFDTWRASWFNASELTDPAISGDLADPNGNGLKNLLVIGNAGDEGLKKSQRGWFIGHFISPDYGLRYTQDVEVKWGIHRTGEQKLTYGANEEGTTLAILISGSFVLHFPELNNSVFLNTVGDFVIFARRVIHGWKAL